MTYFPSATTRTAVDRRGVEFEETVPARLRGVDPEFSADTTRAISDATVAVVRADTLLGARHRRTLATIDAIASSRIENISADVVDTLAKSGDAPAVSVAANISAVLAARGGATARDAHRILLDAEPRHTPGEYRTELCWIGGWTPQTAIFVPPVPDALAAPLDDLEEYTQRYTSHRLPLAAAAIAHAQFETIHPFSDGNGRTGRAFVHRLLGDWDIVRSTVIPFSVALAADRRSYYDSLSAYRRGDVDTVVALFAKALADGAATATRVCARLDDVGEAWMSRPRLSDSTKSMLDVLLDRSVLDAATAANYAGVSTPTAYRVLDSLAEVGICSTRKIGARRVWIADEVIAVIESETRSALRGW